MNRVETHPNAFSKCHNQGHLNNPTNEAELIDAHTACAMSPQGQREEAKIQKTDDKITSESMGNWELEKNLPWSRTGEREKIMSVPMYLYLLNIDIKKTIGDVDQMERKACQTHKWDEALILRGMKNKLNLTREQQLLNVVGSKFDEQAKLGALKSISEKQNIINKRDEVLPDGNMFSEEAKDLWKKWDAEDEYLETNSSFTEREHMMQDLEDEWKVLAAEDKERIAQIYGRTKPDFLKKHYHKETEPYPPY